MPTYTHECAECAHQAEVVCKIAERNDPKECPECGRGCFNRLEVEPNPHIVQHETIEDFVRRRRGHMKSYVPPNKYDSKSNKRTYVPKDKPWI